MTTAQKEIYRRNIQFFPVEVKVNPNGEFFKQFTGSEIEVGDLRAKLVASWSINLRDGAEWAQRHALALTDDGFIQGSVGNFAKEDYYLFEGRISKKDPDSNSRLVSVRLTVANWGISQPFIYHPVKKTPPWIIESWRRSQLPKESWYLMAKPNSHALTLLRGSLRISSPIAQ